MQEGATEDYGEAARSDRRMHSRPFAVPPTVYVFIMIAAMWVSFGFHIRQDGIFACRADGYRHGYYLANCNAADYGDYDHAAIWLGIEREAVQQAVDADVLFIGNSRLQFGFATQATRDWFSRVGRKFYLLGFSGGDGAPFIAPLIKRIGPKARAYVVNVDRFFDDDISPPAAEAMFEESAMTRTLVKRAWQAPHAYFCGRAPVLCRSEPAIYRRPETGEWAFTGRSPNYRIPRIDEPLDQKQLTRDLARAEIFLNELPVARSCVFFIYVYTNRSTRANAKALADGVGVTFSSPLIDGLWTFDSSHLDPASAEIFSKAVLEEIGGPLAKCAAGERLAAANSR